MMTNTTSTMPADRPDDATDNGPDRAPVVRVRDLDKLFARGDTAVAAIDGVSFDVHPGEMVVLVGPSGCGKTTLLRAIAGLERPDSGTIELHGTPCFSSARGIDVPVERRRVSMVFQNYALWPHLTTFQNVVYPLRSQRKGRLSRSQAAERVGEVLELVGIPDLADQYPSEMSGGQRQRVALARALVAGTDLVLFDEPLSNVDAKVRTHLRLELLAMQRDLGFSALFVTHDQAEAMELADRIAVMGAGRIEQFGSPTEVYHEPATRYVADFIGSMNEVTGHVTSIVADPDGDAAGDSDGDVVTVETELGTVHGRAGADLAVGDAVSAIWRPERTLLSDDRTRSDDTARADDGDDGVDGAGNAWRGSVDAALFLGSHTEHVVVVDGHRFLVWSPDVMRHDDDVEVRLTVDPRHVRVLPSDPSSASVGPAGQ